MSKLACFLYASCCKVGKVISPVDFVVLLVLHPGLTHTPKILHILSSGSIDFFVLFFIIILISSEEKKQRSANEQQKVISNAANPALAKCSKAKTNELFKRRVWQIQWSAKYGRTEGNEDIHRPHFVLFS